MQKGIQDLKWRAENTNGLTYVGKSRFVNGNRIVLYQSDKYKKQIAIYGRNGAVFRLEGKFDIKDLNELDNHNKFQSTVGLFVQWRGYKIIPKKYCYHGDVNFQFQFGSGKELKLVAGTDQWQVYNGQFAYGIRHGKGVLKKNSQTYDGQWKRGLLQGKVIIDKKQQSWFMNGNDLGPYSTEIEKDFPINTDIQPFYTELVRYGEFVDENMLKSIQPNKWLSTSAVDFFMAHLEFAFMNHPKKKKEVLINRVRTYQKMVTSGNIYNSKEINHNEVKKNGQAYKNLTSIFYKFPLIIFPYNCNTSHFSLAFILSKIQYRDGELQSVEFQLGELDPLGHANPQIHHQMANYILNQITSNIHQAQRNKYLQALNDVESGKNGRRVSLPQFRPNVTTQPNFHDCGIYVCAYALLLVMEVGLGEKVKWNFGSKYEKEQKGLGYKMRQFMYLDIHYGVVDLFSTVRKILDC